MPALRHVKLNRQKLHVNNLFSAGPVNRADTLDMIKFIRKGKVRSHGGRIGKWNTEVASASFRLQTGYARLSEREPWENLYYSPDCEVRRQCHGYCCCMMNPSTPHSGLKYKVGGKTKKDALIHFSYNSGDELLRWTPSHGREDIEFICTSCEYVLTTP